MSDMSNGKEIVWGASYGSYTQALHKLGSLTSHYGSPLTIQDEQVVMSHEQAQRAIDALVLEMLTEAANRIFPADSVAEAQLIIARLRQEYANKAASSTVRPEGLPEPGSAAPIFVEDAGPFRAPVESEDEIKVSID